MFKCLSISHLLARTSDLDHCPIQNSKMPHTIPAVWETGRIHWSVAHPWVSETSAASFPWVLNPCESKALFQRPNTWGTRCDAPPLPWIQKNIITIISALERKISVHPTSVEDCQLILPNPAFHAPLAKECHSPSAANIFQPTGLAKINAKGGQKRTFP